MNWILLTHVDNLIQLQDIRDDIENKGAAKRK